MAPLAKSRTLSVAIDCPADRAYRYISDPRNLPAWARGFCRSIERRRDEWVADTAAGPMTIAFVPANDLGVLDHVVTPAGGPAARVPMRVIPNGSGCEVLITLLQTPDMSDEVFEGDALLVERDLATLKGVLDG